MMVGLGCGGAACTTGALPDALRARSTTYVQVMGPTPAAILLSDICSSLACMVASNLWAKEW